MYYPNNYTMSPYYNKGNDRFIGLVPFLGGALVGGAAVGLTRPRPIYNVAPQGPGFNPYMPYGNYSYSYYYPTYGRPY